MNAHPLEAILVEEPRGAQRVVGDRVAVGVLVVADDGRIWVLPKIGLDEWQASQLLAAADSVWLHGADSVDPLVWRPVGAGMRCCTVLVRCPRARYGRSAAERAHGTGFTRRVVVRLKRAGSV